MVVDKTESDTDKKNGKGKEKNFKAELMGLT